MSDTRVYVKGKLDATGFPIADVSEHLEREGAVVWVDLCDPSKDELDELASELGLHELAVEDALEPHQRPKLDRYPTHLFLACHAVTVDAAKGALVETEIDAFIGKRWLVTVRSDDHFPMADVLGRWDQSTVDVRVSYLLYGLLDVVVDGYFDGIEVFDDFYDEVSEGIFSERPLPPDEQRHWFQMRQALVRFHKLVLPLREAVSSLMRREHTVIPDELYPYYQDVYDHLLRVVESTDALRDLITTIVETNLSLRDYRQNQVMKKVTSWAAIIAVPTLITGYYGMNVPYPGFGRDAGAATSAILIVLGSLTLYGVFRRKDWL